MALTEHHNADEIAPNHQQPSTTSSPPSPSQVSSNKGRRGQKIDREFSLDEKRDVNVEVVQLPPETTPKSRLRCHARSLCDLFSWKTLLACGAVLVKFGKFTGPGSIISVAYIDPDNFQTAITSGALLEFKLLFIVLVANLIAIYLQVSLSWFCASFLSFPFFFPSIFSIAGMG